MRELPRIRPFVLYDWKVFFLVQVLLLGLIIILHEGGGDFLVSKNFYSAELPHWPWRDHFLTQTLFHKGGVKFAIALGSCILGFTLYSGVKKKNRLHLIQGLFVLVCVGISSTIVYFIKINSRLACPWSLQIYGGDRPDLGLQYLFSTNYPVSRCFPAGHSSAFFPYISWYFVRSLFYPKQIRFLIPGLVAGLFFGLVQQMRGAHFLSHDLSTLWISLSVSWVLSWITYGVLKKCDIGFK